MIIRLNKTLYLVCCFLISFSVFSQKINTAGLKAKIEILKQDRMVSISGYAKNEASNFIENLSYKLLVLKKSVTGKYSNNLQTGDFSILAKQKKLLSNVKINLQKGEVIKVYLYLRKNNVLITKDSLTINDLVKKLARTSIKEKNIVLNGLVIDEVLTKPGKDFYDYFYRMYKISGLNYPFIIKINEKPSFGISSQIFVKVGDRIIYRFLAQPKEEFLQNQAQNALRAIDNYNKYQKNVFKNSNY